MKNPVKQEQILEAAYGGLLHDIGKFIQRTCIHSDLTSEEMFVVPINKTAGYPTHLHAGYTSRFMKNELGMFDAFEQTVSSHHLPAEEGLSSWIQSADWIASNIDRSDEEYDAEKHNKRNRFKQMRLTSVFSEVDFGRKKQEKRLPLHEMSKTSCEFELALEKEHTQAVLEYQKLYQKLLDDLHHSTFDLSRISRQGFDRLYSLLQEYTTSIPASTYNVNKTFVSLFDHLKLTSAIASCLATTDGKESFRMLEFDISGIQKFIFQVTEGSETKKGIAKALRGRSLLISLITDYIVYSYLREFGLTQANIIFQTGGGALLLLPDVEEFDVRIQDLTRRLQKAVMDTFGPVITFVQAHVCLDKVELEHFKEDKAIHLKAMLDEEKSRKYLFMLEDGTFEQEEPHGEVCTMCGQMFTQKNNGLCTTCEAIQTLSDFYIKHEQLYLAFDFDHSLQLPKERFASFSIGECTICLTDYKGLASSSHYPAYVESINHHSLGTVRYLANLAPMFDGQILPLDEICGLIPKAYGDPKLGILKMDVDNLGAVFAYGLPAKTRSLSKFLTLSRRMELFFGKILPEICQEVSLAIDPELEGGLLNNDTLFYINYAGGDDLVILGPAAGILYLAEAINDKFNIYTANENLTISGGIFIQKPQEPVRFGIQNSETYLEKSKQQKNKHTVTLLDTTIPFQEFSSVLKQVEQYRLDLLEGLISRSYFYTLMSVLNTDDFEVFCRRVPIILYGLQRNISNQDYRRTWMEKIQKISDKKTFEQTVPRMVLIMKLAIMQTREEK